MSMPSEPFARAGQADLEVVLTSLSGSGTLDLLGMTTDDLEAARADSALFETLRITHELLMTLRDEGVLGTFLLLPKDRQANFVRWIGATDDENLRRDRTETFISALKQAPLADSARYGGSGK
jgi:predicted nucleotidyltransferase